MDWKRYAFLLAVTASALYATPQLQLSTTALGPIHIAPNAAGPTQTISASNIGDGSLNLSVTASATWLQPSVAANSSIQIALSTASLAPGTYTEFVTVSSPGAIDAPQNVTVTIQVGGVPAALTYYAAPGGTPVTQQVITQGKATATAVTSSGSGWLAVSLSGQGSFTTYFPYNVTVTPQTGQAASDYAGTVTFSGSPVASDNKAIAVTLHLTTSPIQQFSPANLVLTSGGSVKATATVSALNAGQGTLSLTGVTASANWLTGSVNGTTITVTADPTGLTAGTYQGTLTVNSNAANTASATLPVEFVVKSTTAPVLSFGGVVDNATFAPIISPGMISQAYGTLLSGAAPTLASSLPLSTNLGGVQVLVNGTPAPVYYASSGVVDFVVPFGTQIGNGKANVTLLYNGVSSNTVSTNIAARAPRILSFPLAANGRSYQFGIMINASDGSYPVPTTPGLFSHPAKRGDTVTVYMLGLGLTDQQVADGAASPTSPLANTPTPTVIIGGGFDGTASDGAVQFCGLAPGFVGLYQLNVTIPSDAPLGNAIAFELQFGSGTSSPVTSNPVYLAISN
jgi:uncharacterized protein (TIGR03437 family)